MENPFDQMRAAVQAARALNRAVDDQANAIADLLEGRLENVSRYRLARLKKQLKRFNAHTGRWDQEGA